MQHEARFNINLLVLLYNLAIKKDKKSVGVSFKQRLNVFKNISFGFLVPRVFVCVWKRLAEAFNCKLGRRYKHNCKQSIVTLVVNLFRNESIVIRNSWNQGLVEEEKEDDYFLHDACFCACKKGWEWEESDWVRERVESWGL